MGVSRLATCGTLCAALLTATTIAAADGATSSGASTPASSIDAGQTLASGSSLVNGRFSLVMQSDGNLVEYWDGGPIWTSNTAGNPGADAVLQTDGNFVIYRKSHPLWSTRTSGAVSSGYVLSLVGNGDFVIAQGARFVYSSSTAAVRLHAESQPAFNGDAGDPTVVYNKGTYYAFSTGNALGNNLQALVSTQPTTGYHSYTNKTYGSTALPNPPSWQSVGSETSPSVINYGGEWHMFYDAYLAGTSFNSGHVCLAEASATSLTPASPVFTDTSTGPLECQYGYGGALDPSAFVDPTTNTAWLVWKTNDGSSTQASHLWVAKINANGNGISGTPTMIWTNNTVSWPWETTMDNPDLVRNADGHWIVLFSTGSWVGSSYAEAYITCSAPTGPCTQPDNAPILSTASDGAAGALGPAGGSLFSVPGVGWYLVYEAWGGGAASCTNYNCGAIRKLYVAPFDLGP